MAKAKATVTRAPSGGTIVIAQPASPALRRASAAARAVGGAIKKHGRRVGASAAKKAWARKQLIGAAAVGAALGYVRKNNVDLPSFGPLGKNGTAAAALVLASMFIRSDWVDAAASGAVAVAAYDWQETGQVHGVGRRGQYDHIHRIIDQAQR